MDLIDIVLGVYLALVMHSLTMSWLTANGTRSVMEGVRCLMDPLKENFDWYVEQERRIRERDWMQQQYYIQQQQLEEMSLRGATVADWNAAQTAWGEVCAPPNPPSAQVAAAPSPAVHSTPMPTTGMFASTHHPMLPAADAYVPPIRPQVVQQQQLPPVRGTLQTPVPTASLPASSQPMLQPLQGPADDDDGYGSILSCSS